MTFQKLFKHLSKQVPTKLTNQERRNYSLLNNQTHDPERMIACVRNPRSALTGREDDSVYVGNTLTPHAGLIGCQ